MGMLPGIAQDEEPDRRRNLDDSVLKRQVAIIDSMTPERAQSRRPQGEPQEAHRRRLRHQGRGDQQAAQDAPDHGRRDEGDGRRQARPDGGLAQMMGMGGGMPSPEEMAKLAEKMPGGAPGAPGLPPTMPGLPPKFPGLPGLGRSASCRRPAGCRRDFPDLGRRSENEINPLGHSGFVAISAFTRLWRRTRNPGPRIAALNSGIAPSARPE